MCGVASGNKRCLHSLYIFCIVCIESVDFFYIIRAMAIDFWTLIFNLILISNKSPCTFIYIYINMYQYTYKCSIERNVQITLIKSVVSLFFPVHSLLSLVDACVCKFVYIFILRFSSQLLANYEKRNG